MEFREAIFFLEKEDIFKSSEKGKVNSFFFPSKSNPKLIVCIKNKQVFSKGLEMWFNTSIKKKVIGQLILWLFNLQLLKIFFFNNFGHINFEQKTIKNLVKGQKILAFNIYIGLSKKNNASLTFQLFSSNKTIYYSRLPLNDESNKHALKEFSNILHLIKHKTNLCVANPISQIPSNTSFFYTYSEVKGEVSNYNLNTEIYSLLRALQSEKYVSIDNLWTDEHKNLINGFILLQEDIVKGQLGVIWDETIINLSKAKYKETFYHGDFVYWNILRQKNKLNLIDFEYSIKSFLPLYDLCHYFYIGRNFYLKSMSKDEIIFMIEKVKAFSNNEKSLIKSEESSIDDIIKSVIISYLLYLLYRFVFIEGYDSNNARVTNSIKNIFKIEGIR